MKFHGFGHSLHGGKNKGKSLLRFLNGTVIRGSQFDTVDMSRTARCKKHIKSHRTFCRKFFFCDLSRIRLAENRKGKCIAFYIQNCLHIF